MPLTRPHMPSTRHQHIPRHVPDTSPTCCLNCRRHVPDMLSELLSELSSTRPRHVPDTSPQVVTKLHQILRPFLLRRLKQDVELGARSSRDLAEVQPRCSRDVAEM